MTFDEWEEEVPEAIRSDPLWKVEAYRLGLFLADLAWPDALRLLRHKLMRSNADQLYRTASYISSNVGEGWSRSMPNDRARFYEYALGSAREARDWYYKGRRALTDKVMKHRMLLCTQIIRLLVTMIANERRRNRRILERGPDGPA